MTGRPTTRRFSRHSLRETALAAALLPPSAVVFAMFFFYPLYRLVDLGLHQQNRFGTAERYVGFSQYRDVLTGNEFLGGLGHRSASC